MVAIFVRKGTSRGMRAENAAAAVIDAIGSRDLTLWYGDPIVERRGSDVDKRYIVDEQPCSLCALSGCSRVQRTPAAASRPSSVST